MAKSSSSGGNWVTINGVHVLIGADGKISKGPAHFIGKSLDNLTDNAPRTSSNQVKSTRLDDYNTSVSLLSAQSEMKKYKKELKEKKETPTDMKSKRVYYEKSLEYLNATPERQAQLMKEAEKVGMSYTPTGTYVSLKKAEACRKSAEKSSQIQKMNREYEKRFKEAITKAEKDNLIKEARSKNINLTSEGKVGAYYSTPQQIVTIRGMKFDLSVTKARKDAINMGVTLSPQGREKFAEVLRNFGYDPITGKPLK